MNFLQRIRQLSPFRIIVLSFLILILCGTALLMLPLSTADGGGATFTDALFTAVSASCVTGLTTQNTATYWSAFGQTVILLLIQIGGFGVVTVAVAIAAASGRKIGLMQRNLSREAVSASQLQGIVPLLYFILKFTFLIEGIGALLLAPAFCAKEGLWKGLWFAVFHSISSFCNAGFDLFGNSLIDFAGDPVVNLTVMFLIVSGGLGFITWADIRVHRFRFRAYSLQSKIIFLMTAILVFVPAVLFLCLEIEPTSENTHIWISFFQSVTARTAGYNTVDIETFSEGGRAVLIVLMLIGGAPGSTAGGCKMTTAFVLLAVMMSSFRLKRDITCFSRRLSAETVHHAVTVFMMYLLLFFAGSLLISFIDGLRLLDCAFETASAIGTVGLSIGVTEKLSLVSQYVMILLMFFGRIGGLTLIFAANTYGSRRLFRMPEEKLSIG